MKNKNNILFYQ